MSDANDPHLMRTVDYVVDKGGRFRFTVTGRQRYLPYFQRLGIPIDSIDNLGRFRTAKRIIRSLMLEDLERDLENLAPSLDRNWLLATLRQDIAESDRLSDLLRRKQQSGLKVVK